MSKLRFPLWKELWEGVTVVDINTQLVADALSVVTVKKLPSPISIRCYNCQMHHFFRSGANDFSCRKIVIIK